MVLSGRTRKWWRVAAATGLVGVAAAAAPITASSIASAAPTSYISSTGLKSGAIKHVWLIILENKSYDATFTGLNNNTYLWKALPQQGVLLKDYFGTGHFSLDNYTSLVSGQATMPADQNDCPQYADAVGSVVKTGPDAGQFAEAGAPYATSTVAPEGGANQGTGCVYPASVKTLFNQFDSAGVSWKGYAQDMGNPDASGPAHDVNSCGGPGNPAGAGVPNPGSANATDQYVPKHFPFPWFESLLTNPADCNPAHIASLFSSTSGLYHDLQSESTTPAFSWITPNNCSDAHDAVCAGNNLSGGFSDPNTPKPPVNYTGGLYASDLFLEHVIPEIEASPAFKDGGLIDVTFDEANPPFANSSYNNSSQPATEHTYIRSDAAGETVDGKTVHSEPTGPNTPLLKNSSGVQLYPGPGDNAFTDRPAAGSIPGYIKGGGGSVPGARTDTVSAGAGSNLIVDPAITAPDAGRAVTGTNIPAGAYVGPVSDTGPVLDPGPASTGNRAYAGSFQLVDANGTAVYPTGPVTSLTLGAETPATDPLYTATDPAPGGGDTGSVLISPYIAPGTTSTVAYNHYSWLRTMEDLFSVDAKGQSPGLDGLGHLGFAAQCGLAPFGPDVFNNPSKSAHVDPDVAMAEAASKHNRQRPPTFCSPDGSLNAKGAASA
ncbi:alkaline phosphatase family protein [Acidiferrimicrobium sp. IK]|uniref:alkaline phosphatase family protein n=1 Tax=Acidiferrimicrobium sp. IK TaxID=2871700 RepID=UPI0021CB2CF5|nr:alkaline phosphatase family protein [Acidiferrimicrobium sp. IK]MCU4185476.1 alkaline phosphatase family protein [Acidiferrimicrobium sp. IK]